MYFPRLLRALNEIDVQSSYCAITRWYLFKAKIIIVFPELTLRWGHMRSVIHSGYIHRLGNQSSLQAQVWPVPACAFEDLFLSRS